MKSEPRLYSEPLEISLSPLEVFRAVVLLFAIFVVAATNTSAQPTNAFELLDGDRVVFLGDTFIEREQNYGWIEYLLTTQFADRNVTFRNLGWSGDTPAGVSRAGFDPAEKGWDRLKEMIEFTKPTVVFLGYGMANSFDGEAGLPQFANEVNRLLDTIQAIAGQTNPVRFVIFSPLRHEFQTNSLPNPTNHNAQLALYSKALQQIAAARNAWFIPLFDRMAARNLSAPRMPITDDGIHLTSYGYRRIAETMALILRWPPHSWRWGIREDKSDRPGGFGTKILSVDKTESTFRMESLDNHLVWPPWHSSETNFVRGTPDARLQVVGLKAGIYDMKVDGKTVRQVTLNDIAGAVFYNEGPQFDQARELLATIKRKNELFFHRWRPQNNTYLFLFRKHEQGQNAKEIPQFDPLIEEAEKKIVTLRKPLKHVTEFVWVGEGDRVPARAAARKSELHETSMVPTKALPLPKLELEDGLEISLWAENPLLAKPIQINFDPQGRLWVASSSVYPQIQPGQVADDKILVLEDTNNDGKADKTTVFADGLLIPTGVEPGDGGAYVGQSTELLFLKDTDGDGKSDHRRVVLSGFGTEDTHHILHTLRWGHDGQLYMCQSIYIHSHLETPHGVIRLNSGGTLSLRPSTMEVGILMKGLVNQWGHHIDEYGQSFATDGAGGMPPNGIFYVLPGGMYYTYASARRTLGSISPGSYPKFCGLEIIHSEQFPPEWQGNMVTCDFRANRVVRFAVQEQGSAYVTREMPDVIRTKDVFFRPIDVKVGPDGAIYIADWSNPIIQHGEVDFRDPRRDHEHGRIWRVTFEGRSAVKKPDLVNASNQELLDQLLSSNGFNREKAKRVLTERGTNVLTDVAAWAGAHATSEKAQLEVLWMYQALDALPPEKVEKLLQAKDGRIRAAAVRVLSSWMERQPPAVTGLAASSVGWAPAPQPLPHRQEIATARALDLLAKRVGDEHPRVRLEALRALARIPSGWAAITALQALDRPMDEFLEYAAWLTINDLAVPWITAIEAGIWTPDEHSKALQFGVKSIEPALASRVLKRVVRDIPRDGSGTGIELIGQAGGPELLRKLFDQIVTGGFEERAEFKALNALEEAARIRKVTPPGDLLELAIVLDRPSVGIRSAAARLAGAWKLQSQAPALVKMAREKENPLDLRVSCVDALRETGGEGVAKALRELTDGGQPDRIRRHAAVALTALDLSRSRKEIISVITSITKEDDSLALWRALLNTKGAAASLATVLPQKLPEAVARAGLRVAREGGRTEPDLILALSRSAGLRDEAQNLAEPELMKIAASVKDGDPARGEMVYRKKELGCVLCHSIGGAGGKVGPDLTSLGASAQPDYIVESVLAPTNKVKEGFHSIQVTTKDGEEFSGVQVRDNTDEVVIRDATNTERSVPKTNVETKQIGGSIMPSGLTDLLTSAEQRDLFRFLCELGKPGPFDATKGNVARVWRCNTTSDAEAAIVQSDVKNSRWFPFYTTVAGDLPRNELESDLVLKDRREVFFAAARFHVAKPGRVSLKLTGLTSPKAWIDGKPVGGASDISNELPSGAHTIVLKLDPQQLPEAIRLESREVTFLVD
jgi:putative heme-binding domain-containing protein